MADNKKLNLTSADIANIRNVIESIMKSNEPNSKVFLEGVKDGLTEQVKVFNVFLKSLQQGFLDPKETTKELKKILPRLLAASEGQFDADKLAKSLSSVMKTKDKFGEFKQFLSSEINKPNNSNKLELSTTFSIIDKAINRIQTLKTNLDEAGDEIIDSIRDSGNEIIDTLDALTLFHRQLEMMSTEYADQNISSKLIGINIAASQEQMEILLDTASKYSDMLSFMDIPSISADEAISEFNKLKKDISSDNIDIAGQIGVSFKEASKLMSDRFNTELTGIEDRVVDIKDNVMSGILAIKGLTQHQNKDTGKSELRNVGMDLVDSDVAMNELKEAGALQEIFNVIADYNALIITFGKDNIKLDQEKLDLATKLVSEHIDMGKISKENFKTNEEVLEYMDEFLLAGAKEISTLKEKGELLLHIHTSAASTLKLQQQHIKLSQQELQLVDRYRTKLMSIEGVQENILDELQWTLNSLPLWTQKLLGTDKAFQKIEQSAHKAFDMMTEKLFNVENPATFFDALTGYVKDFTKLLTGAVNPITLIAIGLALVAVAAYNIMGNVKDISEELGISKGEAYKLYDAMLLMEGASGNIAVTQERIMALQAAHIEQYGRLIDLQSKEGKNLIEYASLMSSAYGVAATDAMEMIELFKQIGANDELANNLAASTLEAAKLAKISPKIIAKDLIDGAEMVSIYFGNMPAQAAQAAINIRRMGSNIKRVGEQMQSTWNIESFMTDMYEVAQLSGGRINLSAVFDAGIAGDAELFQETLLESLGSLEDLNNESAQMQSKIAKTLNMSVTEMKNMLKMSEMNLDLSKEETTALNKHLDTMGDITGMSKADLEAKAKQFAATEAMNMAWTKIKATLTRAILPIIEVISDVIVALSPIIDLIGFGFKLIGLAIKPFIPALKGIGWILGIISDVVTNLFRKFDYGIEYVENWGGSLATGVKYIGSGLLLAGALAGKFGLIGKLVSGLFLVPWKMLKGMVGMTGKMGGLFSKMMPATMKGSVLGNMIPENLKESVLGKTFKGGQFMPGGERAPAGGATSGGLFSTLKDKILGKATTSVEPKGAGLSETLKGQIDKGKTVITDSGKKLSESIKSGFSSISTFIKDGLKTLGEGIKSGLDFLKDILGKLADAIMEPLKIIGKGAADIIKNILTGIADGLNKFTPKAAIGAASLLIVSGALWVTSKALKEFNTVEWESLAKGMIAITALAGVAMMLGSSSAKMIVGAVAIAALGASLLPAAYSLEKFNNVEWDSVGKGIITIGALAGMAMVLSSASSKMIIGAVGIAALGLALIPMTYSLEKFNSIEWSSVGKGVVALGALAGISMLLGAASPKIILGSIAIAILGASLIPMSYALEKFNDIEWASVAKAGVALLSFSLIAAGVGSVTPMILLGALGMAAMGVALIPLAFSLKMFNDVDWSSVAKGAVAILGLGTVAAGLGTVAPMLLIGAASIAALGIALIPTAYALNQFNTVEWESVGKGVVALGALAGAAVLIGTASAPMLIGAAAIGLLGLAMIPFAYSMKMFNEIEWSSIGKAGVALLGFGALAALIAPAAPFIIAGAAAIAVLGLSLAVFGAGLTVVSFGLEKMSAVTDDVLNSISKLSEVNPLQLIGIAAGLGAIGIALAVFSAGAMAGGLMSIFTGDPIAKISELGNQASNISLLAASFVTLVAALKEYVSIATSIPKLKIDTKMLNQLDLKPTLNLDTSELNKISDVDTKLNIDSTELDKISTVDTKLNIDTSQLNSLDLNPKLNIDTKELDSFSNIDIAAKLKVNSEELANINDTNAIKPLPTPEVKTPESQFAQTGYVIPNTIKSIPGIHKNTEENMDVENTNKTTNYNSNTHNQSLGNAKIESLLQSLVNIMQHSATNPIPAIIGGEQIPIIAKKIKAFNNR